ncbi:MAG TPA: hypothetical protein PLZ86_07245, partial [bacterium]|nr:hypothetical protein [bacterium]
MPAIIGVLPILVYAGYAAAAALAAALLTSCDGGKAHDTDGDLRPDDDGKNPVDDDAADTDGIQDSPEVDVSDDDGDIEADLDGGADDDTHDDDTDPACEGRAGFNPCVAKLAGSVGDIDDSLKGLAVFGGSPASVYVCETEGLASASCTAKATLPAGLRAAQFSETPFGYWVATATPEGAAVPVSFFHIDDAASSPASAVLNRKDISQITVGSGSDEVVLDITRSGGIAVFEADEEPSERFFLGLDALSDGASTSLLGNLRNFDGD